MEIITIPIPSRLTSEQLGYYNLLSLYHNVEELTNCEVQFDFKNNTWFEANLAAIFGVICDFVVSNDNNVNLINLNDSVLNILQRNGFMTKCGLDKTFDTYGTTISYRKFAPEEGSQFSKYIKDELLSKPDFPNLSNLLSKRINQSIYELFENARTHGKCDNIYTCGQYYPNKMPPRIDMTIVDLGISISKNVNDYFQVHSKPNVDAATAIEWAIKKGNTTKVGNISGGLGLDLVMEFLKLNKGKIQIVSNNGYWEYRKSVVLKDNFDRSFPGTIVNIEFNLDDKSFYQLKEEVSLEDIF